MPPELEAIRAGLERNTSYDDTPHEERPIVEEPTERQRVRAEALLNHVKAKDRVYQRNGGEVEGWIDIMLGLRHELGKSEYGLRLWDEWSAEDTGRYKGIDDLRNHWYSNEKKSGPVVTLDGLLSRNVVDVSHIPAEPTIADEFDAVPEEQPESEGQKIERTFRELAKLEPVAYDLQREETAKRLGIRLSTLDSEVDKRRPKPEEETELIHGYRTNTKLFDTPQCHVVQYPLLGRLLRHPSVAISEDFILVPTESQGLIASFRFSLGLGLSLCC